MRQHLSHPSKAKVVVFDIDGVLINSADAILEQAKYWLKHIRNRDMTTADLRRARRVFSETGDPDVSLKRILQCTEIEWSRDKQKLMKVHNDGFQLFKNTMLPYEGAVQLIQDLRNSKNIAAFTTRKRDFFNTVSCPQLIPPASPENPDGLFHTTITADDVDNIKPHPEGLYTIAKRLGVDAHEMVLIGDSPTDIVAGNEAGCITIAIAHPRSFANKTLLKRENPEYFAQSIDDLRALLLRQA